jgi:hypothetical protein
MEEVRRERGQRAAEEKPVEKKAGQKELPGKAPSDPKLLGLFRRLIQPDKSPADVDEVIKEIQGHVKESEDLQAQVRDGVKLIDSLGYGTEYSKTARKKLAEEYKK